MSINNALHIVRRRSIELRGLGRAQALYNAYSNHQATSLHPHERECCYEIPLRLLLRDRVVTRLRLALTYSNALLGL